MTHPVRLTRAAEADIAQAFDWYEAKTENLGFEFIEQVERAIERISEHPLSHRKIVDDVRRANLDRFPYGLWYRIDPDGSIVIACLHHKRNPRLASARARQKPKVRASAELAIHPGWGRATPPAPRSQQFLSSHTPVTGVLDGM